MQSTNPFVENMQEYLGILMRKSMVDFFQQAREGGLSMAQIGALASIRHRKMCGISEFGEEMGVTSAAASQMIDRLAQQGLISRSEDPRDRRVRHVGLTEKGQQVLQSSIQARQRWLEELSFQLTPVELDQINSDLRLLIEKAKMLDQAVERD